MTITQQKLFPISTIWWFVLWIPLCVLTSSWVLLHAILLFIIVMGFGAPYVIWPNKKHKINPPIWTLAVSLLGTIVLYGYLNKSGISMLLPDLLGL